MFPPALEQDTFRASNGECGWTRAQVPLVVDFLKSHKFAILGGELCWVRDGFSDWTGLIPQRNGPPGVYPSVTNREPGEPWQHFVQRGASDALAAVERWPAPDDLPAHPTGRSLYNLTWVSDEEFQALGQSKI